MAGLSRRTHYRKHVTDSVLHDLPEPGVEESIAVVVNTRGSNQFDIRLPHLSEIHLAILPTKFRKLVWLKRNDYVIVKIASTDDKTSEDKTSNATETSETGGRSMEEEEADTGTSMASTDQASRVPEETGSIRCVVTHILYSDQITHLIAKGLWPREDPDFLVEGNHQRRPVEQNEASDGIVYEQGYGKNESGENSDDDLFVNTNRISRITIQDDPSSSDSDDD